MKARPELNGTDGYVIAFHDDKGRYEVRLFDNSIGLVEPGNLTQTLQSVACHEQANVTAKTAMVKVSATVAPKAVPETAPKSILPEFTTQTLTRIRILSITVSLTLVLESTFEH